jgi:hypothetical protein
MRAVANLLAGVLLLSSTGVSFAAPRGAKRVRPTTKKARVDYGTRDTSDVGSRMQALRDKHRPRQQPVTSPEMSPGMLKALQDALGKAQKASSSPPAADPPLPQRARLLPR